MLDLSSAVPWLVIGFLAGLLTYFLARALFGSGSAAELAKVSGQLDAANQDIAALSRTSESHATKAKYYEDEFNSLSAHLTALGKSHAAELEALREDLRGHAAKAKYYENEYNSLSAHVASLGKAHAAELEALREASHNNANKAKHYEAELHALRDAHHALLTSSQAYTDDIARLKAELAAAHSEATRLKAIDSHHHAEISNLKAEAARLTEALASAAAREQAAALQHHATKNDLEQVRMGLEETSRILAERHTEIDQLKTKLANMPDVEKYKRFKEALDAANLIAAGPPEKA